ncbi:hypothetical protein TWF694_007192 [Orbilia ellipsospora]|uniref:Uncharacterized protein n=1 Tax=Orbilia ellipsospora TaxID=2528407 RepID=A0AAV9XJP4_9PEZI
MKATVLIALFAAVVAAAPQPPVINYCGGKTGLKCPANKLCVGEAETQGEKGVCISLPAHTCGDMMGTRCAVKSDYCYTDPRIHCPPGVMDCGGGVCVPLILGNSIMRLN